MTNVVLLIGNWLIPGVGFVAKGRIWRGIVLFLLINGTFAIGLFLHGAVLVPEFNYRSPAFNIVNLLTFFGQMGNGGASLLTLVHDRLGWGIFPTDERSALFDLASLYLLVAGCMNYFCVMNFYDRYMAPEDVSEGKEAQAE
jgi:hypothetical protein